MKRSSLHMECMNDCLDHILNTSRKNGGSSYHIPGLLERSANPEIRGKGFPNGLRSKLKSVVLRQKTLIEFGLVPGHNGILGNKKVCAVA